ncbi:hypothetical protein IFM89_032461 [Coptis chinensis]|uniref:Nucleoside diphosphate kinase-like domain-containing protein n=1 Tax=Coptis chinensis TaxID=261450 RepID=A0A835I585_9MAGN|nr:hypothetical protein IFM89_032461 [Coptis chinensis]
MLGWRKSSTSSELRKVIQQQAFLEKASQVKTIEAPGEDANQHNDSSDRSMEKTSITCNCLGPPLENVEGVFSNTGCFIGIHGQGVRVPVRLHGSDDIPLRNLTFRDMSVGTTYKKKHIFQCAFVQGRVIGTIFPAPCDNLDLYNEQEQSAVASCFLQRSQLETLVPVFSKELHGGWIARSTKRQGQGRAPGSVSFFQAINSLWHNPLSGSYASTEKEKTLAMIKPDGLNYTGYIKRVIDESGFSILKATMVQLDESNAALFYAEHSERTFFPSLVKYITRY